MFSSSHNPGGMSSSMNSNPGSVHSSHSAPMQSTTYTTYQPAPVFGSHHHGSNVTVTDAHMHGGGVFNPPHYHTTTTSDPCYPVSNPCCGL